MPSGRRRSRTRRLWLRLCAIERLPVWTHPLKMDFAEHILPPTLPIVSHLPGGWKIHFHLLCYV